MRLATVCTILFVSCSQLAGSQELLGDPELRAAPRTASPPLLATELINGERSWSDEKTRSALLSDLADWLSRYEGMPSSSKLPRIIYANSASISALRYRSVLKLQPAGGPPSNSIGEVTTVAIYVDDESTIYLRKEFAGRTAADLSVLIHELVHHIQSVAGLRYECPQAREREAYQAQDRWLRQFGTSLAEEFDVDPFTTLVNSLCVY